MLFRLLGNIVFLLGRALIPLGPFRSFGLLYGAAVLALLFQLLQLGGEVFYQFGHFEFAQVLHCGFALVVGEVQVRPFLYQ